jgi:hypothetical protein
MFAVDVGIYAPFDNVLLFRYIIFLIAIALPFPVGLSVQS